MVERAVIERIEPHEDWLRLWFEGGAYSDFHFRWLRHNAPEDCHPLTRERTLCSSELPARLVPLGIEASKSALLIHWTPGRAPSEYTADWLKEHAYAWNREDVALPSNDVGQVTVDARRHASWQSIVRALTDRVEAHGIGIVRGRLLGHAMAEAETESIIVALNELGLSTTLTHFGRIEDLRTDNATNANTDQLGYTNASIELHTDQPFLEKPPRYQLLQSIRRADRGGESYFVDARQAAIHLGSFDEEALKLLRETPVRFHRKQAAFEKAFEAPIVRFFPERFEARLSYFTLAPHQLPFSKMDAFYRAHDAFVSLVREPRHQRRVLLEEGELVLYDNHRTLHARTGFDGARWVRGVYFD